MRRSAGDVGGLVARTRRLDADVDLLAFARTQLAPFKVPRHVVVVDELPMTASGKVRKFLLRTDFLADAAGS